MNEEEKVKKQLSKNMLLNLITFSIIFYMLGSVIYGKFNNSLYMSADSELEKVMHQQKKKMGEKEKPMKINIPEQDNNNPKPSNDDFDNKDDGDNHDFQNPRLVFIERSENGTINEDSNVSEIFKDVDFNKDLLSTIYEVNINNEYSYRAINYKLEDGTYRQVLINVDAEKDIANQFKKTLIVTIIICIIVIVIASYLLSKRTLKPIIVSWKKQTKFVQDASHELRTPLAIIKAKQETLLERPESKIIDNAEDISTTLKETQRLTKLINELMELARNDSKEMKLNKEKFLLDKEIGALIGLYKQVAETQEKTLTLELNYKDYIYADQNKLKELLIILLDNSLKYTEPKDSIKIKTYKKENRCIIEVIDTGIGISKQDQEHIFERFYRAEKSRAREKGGMGLGLSIAYNIVKLHKGTIKVDNKNIEKGTRMIVKLPIK